MSAEEPDPTVDALRRRQLAQEQAEREQLQTAENDADADRHRRRAEKAQYLRQKLEERQRSERDGAGSG